MKKLLSMVMILVIVLSMAVTAMAADFQVGTSKQVVDAGEEVTVTVSLGETLTHEKNFRNCQGELYFDTAAVTYVSHSMGSGYSDFDSMHSAANSRVQFSKTAMNKDGYAEIPAGTVVTVTFKANETMTVDHLSAVFRLEMKVMPVGESSAKTTTSASIVVCKEHTYEGTVTKEPTCGTPGVKTYTCTFPGCGHSYTEEIPATGEHNYTKVVTAPTCTEGGYTTYTCDCGDTYVDDKVDALGHDMQETASAVEATCETAGKTAVKTCANGCGKTEGGDEVDALGHKEEIVPGKAATCTETGLSDGKKCSVCGKTLAEQKEIAAKGHTWDEGTVTKEPTCTEKGEKKASCTVCGAKGDAVEVPAKGHTWDEGKVTKEPTCTEKGIKTYTCACGETKTEEIPAKGHTYDEGKVTTEPTCGKAGVKTYTCACGETKTEDIPATGKHTFNDGKVTKEPTCTKKGEKTYTCDCGETKTEEIKAKGHTDTNKDGVCDVCKNSIPQTGDAHMLIVWISLVAVAAVVIVLLQIKKRRAA